MKGDKDLARSATAGEHEWFWYDRLNCECCRKCGFIRRADDRNKPCRGVVRVGPRDSA